MRSFARPRRHGFTLLELMVVIVILGGLIALVGPNVIGTQKVADRSLALQQMKHFEGALEMYHLHHRRFPATLEGLTELDPKTRIAWMERIPRDPWGSAYVYRPGTDGRYELRSPGEDRQEGTDDDVIAGDDGEG